MESNRVLKLLEVYEKDGITLKDNTDRLNYDDIRGKICEEILPIEEDYAMLLKIEGVSDRFLRTSGISKIEEHGKSLTVYTKNTVYQFEIINTYTD